MILEVIEPIGQGGFGLVEKVRNPKTGKEYARKTFVVNQYPGFPEDLIENAKKRFIREVQVQGDLEHKNIIKVIRANLSEDPPSYLMPLAKSSLADDLKEDRSLDGNYLNAIMDIISALEEMHSLDLFHRDLKPANVLRFNGRKGEADYYAVGDFGFIATSVTLISSLTKTGMRRGSDYYTAPEIVRDLRQGSVRSDIFSLGCILHDFVGKEDRVPCHEIRDDSSDFGAILLGCTRADPHRRFKSVSAVREAILAIGEVTISPKSVAGKEIFELLEDSKTFDKKQWHRIIDFIEDNYGNDDSLSALNQLDSDRIMNLIEVDPELANRFGDTYAKWIREYSFPFATCDALAIRLKNFIDHCSISVKVACLMAMLYMGTSHNRWYVENKFISMTGYDMDGNLAKRLAMEFRIEGRKLCDKISHLEYSVRFKRENFHPELYNVVNTNCDEV